MERKTNDWKASKPAKVLIIGENSTLQWSDEIIPYVMFLDYFFRKKPTDLGERSRFTEAHLVFELVDKLTDGWCMIKELYATNLSLNQLTRPPKGKHILIADAEAEAGVEHIKHILEDNPTIEYIFSMGVQTTYHLEKCGLFSTGGDGFAGGAAPRNNGLNSEPPYYQPINAKAYNDVLGHFFPVEGFNCKLVPLLTTHDYPLSEANIERFGARYEGVRKHFGKKVKISK